MVEGSAPFAAESTSIERSSSQFLARRDTSSLTVKCSCPRDKSSMPFFHWGHPRKSRGFSGVTTAAASGGARDPQPARPYLFPLQRDGRPQGRRSTSSCHSGPGRLWRAAWRGMRSGRVGSLQRTVSPQAAGASSRIVDPWPSGRIATYRSTADPRRSRSIVMPSVINCWPVVASADGLAAPPGRS